MDYINRKIKKGFTVLELTIAMALLAILSVIIATIVIRSGIIFEKQTGSVEVGLSNRFVLDDIAQQVRTAKLVESNFTGDGQNFTTGTDTLILKLPSIDNSGAAIANTFDRVVYYLNAGKINKKVFPDAASSRKKITQILTTTTKTLKFAYNNSNVASTSAVTVDLTTIKKLPSGDRENSDKIEAVLRNY